MTIVVKPNKALYMIVRGRAFYTDRSRNAQQINFTVSQLILWHSCFMGASLSSSIYTCRRWW